MIYDMDGLIREQFLATSRTLLKVTTSKMIPSFVAKTIAPRGIISRLPKDKL